MCIMKFRQEKETYCIYQIDWARNGICCSYHFSSPQTPQAQALLGWMARIFTDIWLGYHICFFQSIPLFSKMVYRLVQCRVMMRPLIHIPFIHKLPLKKVIRMSDSMLISIKILDNHVMIRWHVESNIKSHIWTFSIPKNQYDKFPPRTDTHTHTFC